MMLCTDDENLRHEAMAATLDATGNYRVLRRLRPRSRYANRAAVEGVAAMMLERGRVDGAAGESLVRWRGAEGAAFLFAGFTVSRIAASPEKPRTYQ
jgi:hypothetical protein